MTSHPKPRYQSLADELRELILGGHIPPGGQLPSESALARAKGLGIDTVRNALQVLQQEGLIELSRGCLATVSPPWEREVLELPPGACAMARMPRGPEREQLDLPPGVPVVEVLDGEGFTLHRGDRVMLMATNRRG